MESQILNQQQRLTKIKLKRISNFHQQLKKQYKHTHIYTLYNFNIKNSSNQIEK